MFRLGVFRSFRGGGIEWASFCGVEWASFCGVEWASFLRQTPLGCGPLAPSRRVPEGSSGHPQSSATRTSNEISDFRLEACRAYGA